MIEAQLARIKKKLEKDGKDFTLRDAAMVLKGIKVCLNLLEAGESAQAITNDYISELFRARSSVSNQIEELNIAIARLEFLRDQEGSDS